jgi:hypothetical protein
LKYEPKEMDFQTNYKEKTQEKKDVQNVANNTTKKGGRKKVNLKKGTRRNLTK